MWLTSASPPLPTQVQRTLVVIRIIIIRIIIIGMIIIGIIIFWYDHNWDDYNWVPVTGMIIIGMILIGVIMIMKLRLRFKDFSMTFDKFFSLANNAFAQNHAGWRFLKDSWLGWVIKNLILGSTCIPSSRAWEEESKDAWCQSFYQVLHSIANGRNQRNLALWSIIKHHLSEGESCPCQLDEGVPQVSKLGHCLINGDEDDQYFVAMVFEIFPPSPSMILGGTNHWQWWFFQF